MNRFLSALLLLFIIASMTGCQDKTTESTGIDNMEATVQNEKEDIVEEELETESEEVQPREGCDFRNAKWGDSKDDIRLYEPNIEIKDENDTTLLSYGVVGGYNTHILYYFDENTGGLYQTAYYFDLNYSNAGQYIPVYNFLKDDLTKKYATPSVDSIFPLEKESLIEYAGDAGALEYGYVQYGATWETGTTTIMITMGTENYDVGLVILYIDKNYSGNLNNGL